MADYGFDRPGRGFWSIRHQKSYVNLYLMDGVDLQDPGGLLAGTGKHLRRIKILRKQDLKNKAPA